MLRHPSPFPERDCVSKARLSMRRAVLSAVGGALLLFGAAYVKQLNSSSQALVRSQAAWESGRSFEAVLEARDAAQSVAPWSAVNQRAYQALETYGSEAETKGDFQTSATAWRAMRAAAISSDSLLLPTREWQSKAEEGLLRVSLREYASSEAARAVQSPPTRADLERSFEHSKGLPRSTFVGVAVVVIVFALLVWGVFGKLLRKSFSSESVSDRES